MAVKAGFSIRFARVRSSPSRKCNRRTFFPKQFMVIIFSFPRSLEGAAEANHPRQLSARRSYKNRGLLIARQQSMVVVSICKVEFRKLAVKMQSSNKIANLQYLLWAICS